MTPGLRVSEHDGIAEVVIDRPPVNALARQTYRELKETFDSFRDRDDISVVIFTGTGDRAFCGGRGHLRPPAGRSAPSPGTSPTRTKSRARPFGPWHRAVPVILCCQRPRGGRRRGACRCSDMAIAVDSATFALTEIDVGVLGGASFAQRLVGATKARRMFFTGERVPAAEVRSTGRNRLGRSTRGAHDIGRALATQISSKSKGRFGWPRP